MTTHNSAGGADGAQSAISRALSRLYARTLVAKHRPMIDGLLAHDVPRSAIADSLAAASGMEGDSRQAVVSCIVEELSTAPPCQIVSEPLAQPGEKLSKQIRAVIDAIQRRDALTEIVIRDRRDIVDEVAQAIPGLGSLQRHLRTRAVVEAYRGRLKGPHVITRDGKRIIVFASGPAARARRSRNAEKPGAGKPRAR